MPTLEAPIAPSTIDETLETVSPLWSDTTPVADSEDLDEDEKYFLGEEDEDDDDDIDYDDDEFDEFDDDEDDEVEQGFEEDDDDL